MTNDEFERLIKADPNWLEKELAEEETDD